MIKVPVSELVVFKGVMPALTKDGQPNPKAGQPYAFVRLEERGWASKQGFATALETAGAKVVEAGKATEAVEDYEICDE